MTEINQDWDQNLSIAMINISDAVMITDNNFKIYYINKSGEELFGYKLKELLGKSPDMFNADTKSEEIQRELYETVLSNHVFIGESLNRRKDGSTFICEYKVNPILGEDGKIKSYVGIQRDITEKKRMLQELSTSFERLDQLSKQSRTIIWEVDGNGLYTYVSWDIEDILGYRPDEVVGKMYIYDLFPITIRENIMNELNEIFSMNMPFKDYINPVSTKSGDIIHMSTNGIPLFNKNRDIIGYRGSDLDVTEKEKMKEIIMTERERFKTTLLSVGDGIISTDNKGKVNMMNPIAERLTGWSQDEALGKPLEIIFNTISEITYETLDNPIVQVLQNGMTIKRSNHILLISKDGIQTPIEDTTAPIKNIYGNITGAVIAVKDFTDNRDKQKEIEYLGLHDHITGLYNRSYVENSIKDLDAEENLPFTIMILDVNGLKLTNDAFGHEMGDRLLGKVADILRNSCRASDIIGRMGGDEFYILLPRTDRTHAEKIKHRIASMASSTKIDYVSISLAIGYSIKTSMDQNIDNVKINADNLMYKDKIKYGKNMRRQTIETVLQNINQKYYEEETHTKMVSMYCESMGKAMNLSKKEILDLKKAGDLHDIGKIMVPPELINKEGKLTFEEYESIKRHPEIGYQILKSVYEYAPLAEPVLYHHEHWDGTGYPEGLSQDSIPLYSRIIAVADAYEAMTGKRPYKLSLSKDEAKNELEKFAGIQFDPNIVNIFIEKVIQY